VGEWWLPTPVYREMTLVIEMFSFISLLGMRYLLRPFTIERSHKDALDLQTTAHSLAYILGLLALHPEEQDKLYQQSMEVLGGRRAVKCQPTHLLRLMNYPLYVPRLMRTCLCLQGH
jgi:hypothetical protein